MTEIELNEKAFEIRNLFGEETVSDEEIILQIKELPEIARTKSGANLFLMAVFWNRFSAAMTLADMGVDIHYASKGSMFSGNALNVAHSPQQAERLLALGIRIEKNLLLSKPFWNPAIVAAGHNDSTMMFYWLKKQRELFSDDEKYIGELLYATIDMVSTMNQYDMLARVIADEELFGILKEIYSKTGDAGSIRLYLNALKYIKDKRLDAEKKELQKILNTRKKELTAQ